MELCSIEDAFPEIQKNNKSYARPGGTDSKASKEERRAARKLAKKCKDGPAEEYYNMVDDKLPPVDPDRPSVKRAGEVPAFASYETAFDDLSGSKFEAFRMPRLPATNCLTSDQGLPSYFGKGLEDATTEGFSGMFDDSAASTNPETFEYEFGGEGVEKAGGVQALPAPPLSNVWKPLTPAKVTTAVFKKLPGTKSSATAADESLLSNKPAIKPPELPPAPLAPIASMDYDLARREMEEQIKNLSRRFDELEAKRQRNTQKEIILFVGTGAFILVCMDVVTRLARR
jgi:hypothetical protein